MESGPGSITTLVNEIPQRGAPAGDPRIARLQAELAAMARERVRSLGAGSELRTGDLVNEAYLKLFAKADAPQWENRRHFFGAAARAMQQVVVDLARRIEVRRAHAPRIAVPAEFRDDTSSALPLQTMLRLLEQLEEADPVAAEVVRMRVFAGLSVEDTAAVLGLSRRTAERKWMIGRALARSWLVARMDGR